MITGVYKIKCTANGKFYIGSSTDIARRECEHLRELKKGKHRNAHLQNVYNKYGASSLTFETVFTCPKRLLVMLEQYLLDEYCGDPNCMNVCTQANQPPSWNKGIPNTPEQKKKISIALTGIVRSEETKAKHRGPKSPEHKAAIRSGMAKARESRLHKD